MDSSLSIMRYITLMSVFISGRRGYTVLMNCYEQFPSALETYYVILKKKQIMPELEMIYNKRNINNKHYIIKSRMNSI